MDHLMENCKSILDCKQKKQCGVWGRLHDKEISDNYVIPYGYVGKGYLQKRILILGQNARITNPKRRELDRKFYEITASIQTVSNTSEFDSVNERIMNEIITKTDWPFWHPFKRLDLEEEFDIKPEDVAYSNVVKCKFEKNLVSQQVYQLCTRNVLFFQIEAWGPKFIILVGKQAYDAIAYCQELCEFTEAGRITYMNQPKMGEWGENKERQHKVLIPNAKKALVAYLGKKPYKAALSKTNQSAPTKPKRTAQQTQTTPKSYQHNFDLLRKDLKQRSLRVEPRKSGDGFWLEATE